MTDVPADDPDNRIDDVIEEIFGDVWREGSKPIIPYLANDPPVFGPRRLIRHRLNNRKRLVDSFREREPRTLYHGNSPDPSTRVKTTDEIRKERYDIRKDKIIDGQIRELENKKSRPRVYY